MPRTAEVQRKQDEKVDQQESASWMKLENMSAVPQSVYDSEGKRYQLLGNGVDTFPEHIARLFLDGEAARFVQPFVSVDIPPRPGMPIIWMANMTGNPFAPPEVEVERKEHDNWVKVTVPNPMREPQVLEWSIRRDQETVPGADGQPDVINHPPQRLRLAPFQRHPIPANIMMQLETSDSLQPGEHHRGKIMHCRAPSPGEPDETWKYDEIRAYAHLVDENSFNDVTFPPSSKLETGTDINRIKLALLRHLFFRLVDDRFRLPTRAALSRFKEETLDRETAPGK